MDKNTIWAIALSTVVLVGFMVIQTKFFPAPQKPVTQNKTAVEQPVQSSAAASTETNTVSAAVTAVAAAPAASADAGTAGTATSSAVQVPAEVETTYTIKTNKVKAVFTNRGGDIISYELLDHHDSYTGKGVEMADNISKFNRACSISFGGADNQIINDIFTAKQLDEYTIGFYRTFTAKNSNGSDNTFTLVKQYTFKPDDYAFKLDVMIDSQNPAVGLNFNEAAYTLRTSPQIGPHFDRKVDRYELRSFIAYNGEKAKRINLGEKTFKSYDKDVKWVGIGGKYFIDLVIPADASIIKNSWYSTAIEVNNYADAQARVVRKATTGGSTKDTYYMYFGPRNEKDLRAYNVADKNPWGLSGQHLSESLQSSGWLGWLETILKWMMEMIYKVIPNWGVSIIILTVILKLLLYPLTKKSSLGTLKMQELQPKMTALQAKYKDNPQKLQEETAKMYKETGYNPVSGCLPMLFQFIVLFAMYNLFNNYFEFRGASFIPGWIPDLSVGDSIHSFGFNIPFIGNQLRILPIIYVISQLLFGKITQNGGMGTGASATQMKIMMYGMPIFFFFIFYNAPSGLLLYWTVSNVIQMVQQIMINKLMSAKKAEMAAVDNNPNIKKFPKNGKNR